MYIYNASVYHIVYRVLLHSSLENIDRYKFFATGKPGDMVSGYILHGCKMQRLDSCLSLNHALPKYKNTYLTLITAQFVVNDIVLMVFLH